MEERIEIIYGAVNVLNETIDCLQQSQQRWAICSDSKGADVFDNMQNLKNAYTKAMNRGVKIRLITEITKDNLNLCKRNMHYVSEIRHMEEVRRWTFRIGS